MSDKEPTDNLTWAALATLSEIGIIFLNLPSLTNLKHCIMGNL